MRRKMFLLITIITILSLTIISVYLLNNKNLFANSTSDLINISKLSDKFMKEYFNDIKELNKENNNNILIAISKRDIKDGEGASKIIKAPNNQYILVYNNLKQKEYAYTKLKNNKDILSIEENIEYTTVDNIENQQSTYNSWGVEKMGLDKAMTSIDKSRLHDVTVAILDTGCDMELFNKYYNGKISDYYSVFGDGMYDNNGHGTHIAGTIAESTPDSVKIVPVKDSDQSSISSINIVAGLNWIIYNGTIDVVNMSFGGYSKSSIVSQTIEAAYQQNIICVAAAGNDNTSKPSYPAALDTTITIASTDSSLNKSSFSNYGSHLTFTAPGTNIKSLNGNYTYIHNNNSNTDDEDDFETISGTSMATPHAVSAVALLRSLNESLTKEQIINLLKKSTIDLGDDGWDPIYGFGFIDFSSTNFCDGTDCDQYNVYKNNLVSNLKRIDVGTDSYVSNYNYGNNTNLLNMSIKLYYSDNNYITKDLGELDGLTIEDYDPYLEGTQNITIKYKDFTEHKMVINHTTDGWIYDDYNTNTIEITGIVPTSNYPKYIDVPKIYKGITVENLDYPAFMGRTDIKKAKISAQIKWLNTNTFYGCTHLTSVELPSTIEKIYPYAFGYTPKLYSIDLPANIEEIDSNAFYTTGLETITIPGTVKTISRETFINASSLTSVTLEEGVETIGEKAFGLNSALTSITIPKSVNSIAYNAFALDFNIENININKENSTYENKNNSNTIVNKNTKKLIYANEKSIIPSDVNTIGPYSLNGYTLRIPSTVTKLENNALSNTFYAIIPNSINNIESTSTFTRCDELSNQYLNFVNSNSYAHNYLTNNSLKYSLLDSEDVNIELDNNDYEAFDKVDKDALSILVTYNGNPNVNMTVSNYEINYQNGSDSFRYGDNYFTIEFDNSITGEHHSEHVNVNVSKKTPSYTVPTGLSIKQGKKLSTITLPTGFEWMNPNQVAQESGEHTFTARYIPSDPDNYETIENISIIVNVYKEKTVIVPDISISDKTYDNTTSIPEANINITNLSKAEYTIISATTSDENVGTRTATIKIRLSDSKYEDYSFIEGKQEETFTEDIKIVKADINITDLTENLTVKYDDQYHTININIDRPQNSIIKFMDNNDEYTLDEAPQYKELGEYIIKYKISINSNYNDYYNLKTLIINEEDYIINKYSVDKINNYIDKIDVNTTVTNFKKNIELNTGYTVDVDNKTIDNKQIIYTGGKTKIYKNLVLYKEYVNIVSGDTNGDGKINYLDYVNVYNHIQKTKHPDLNKKLLKDEFLLAADMAGDNKINYLDYVKIYNKIKELKGGSN